MARCSSTALARKVTVAAFAAALALTTIVTAAHAQTTPAAAKPAAKAAAKADPEATGKKNPDVALKAYGAGTRAFESGKMADAVSSLTTALNSGGLQSSQMAKALYYRGAANRKLGKPAIAISDFTSALWLKNGLNDTDRALATDARQAAYKEAGLAETAPPVPVQQTVAAPAATPAPAATAAAPTPAAAPAAAPTAFATETTAAAPAEAAAAAPVKRSAVSAPLDNSLSSMPVPGSDTAPAATPVALTAAPTAEPVAAAPETPGTNPLAGTGTAVSGFFNNIGSSIGKMFGAGSAATDAGTQATLTESSPVQTSSTEVTSQVSSSAPVYANPNGGAPVAAQDAAAQTTGWDQMKIQSERATKDKKMQVAAAVPPAASAIAPAPVAQAPVATKVGKIRVQVASVRSREEAEKVAARVKTSAALQGAGADIDEAVIGNMGTFYRVRVGPYATTAETSKVCQALKPEGYDCMVVSQ